ncbi:hypothetical protein Tco_1242789 [Tanacetum coccineum]
MERGFLSSKGCGGGRGVKEKSRGSINVSAEVKNGVDEGMTTSSNVATNTQGSVNDTTQVTGVMPYDADGPVRVDENVRQKPSNSTDNPNKGGNGLDVVVPVESIRAISERFANTAYGFFLGKCVALPVVANYFSSMEGLYAILENDPWFIWGKIVAGSIIGGLKDTQEMLDFSTKHGVTANVEIIPIDYVNTAMDRILNFAFDGVNNRIMLTVDILLVVVKESKKGQVGDAGAIVASVLPSFCHAILVAKRRAARSCIKTVDDSYIGSSNELTSRSPVQPHYQASVGGKRSDSTARNGALI